MTTRDLEALKGNAIRQSDLSAFDRCALTATFERQLRNRNWATHPQARGSLLHRVLGKCLRDMARMQQGSIPVDAALAILHEVLRQHDVPPDEVLNVPMHEVKDLYWVVKKWAHETEWSVENLVAVEERLYAPVVYPARDGSVIERVMTGQIDALFVEAADHAIVLDWKDTWGLPAPTEVSHKGYFQQRFYAFLVMIAYPTIMRLTLREFYVRYSEVREATITREELDDVRAELTALVERYDRAFAEKVFPPSPGHHCGYCLRPERCPIPVRLRREGKIEDAEDAAIVARQLVVGNSVAKQSRAALAAWADAHGPVPIKDAKGPRVYGYVASEQTRRPDRETLERALATGEVDVDRLYKTVLTARFIEHVPRKDRATDEDVVLLAALEGAVAEAKARQGAE
jgi:hypothetical protein